MSAKVDQASVIETHHVRDSVAASSSASSHGSSKVSMFKGKPGFVIPKNKFSGSLVPIFKAGKKSECSDAASEENSKQVQRKTKWAPDLTQDTTVRRGRALAYQTRVDQISQQLKLGSVSGESQKSRIAGDLPDSELSTMQIDYELQALELERREAIGEILKLNPSYKAPSDYQPVTREAIVSVPIKEHPGYNFLSLIYGPDGETRKRLEKDTGTKIQVYGTKSETEEEVEVTGSDRSELLSSCSEIYVRILGDTCDKVDAAAALIELLLTSVSGNSVASKASASVSEDIPQVLGEGQGVAAAPAVSAVIASQELVRPVIVPASNSSQGPLQPYPGSWFPTGQPNMPSGLPSAPSSMAFTFNHSAAHPVFGLSSPSRPPAPYGFGSSPQGIQIGPSRLNPPVQMMRGPFVPPAYPLGQTGAPRNHSATMSPSPFVGQQPAAAGSPRLPAQLIERPLTPTASSPGWAPPRPAGVPQSLASGSMVPPIDASQGAVVSQSASSSLGPPSAPSSTQAFPSQIAPTSATSFMPSQSRSSSSMLIQAFGKHTPLVNSSSNAILRPAQTLMPPHVPQSGMPSRAAGTLNAPSFTPLMPMVSAAPRAPLPGSSDFTFQPHRPQGPPQSVPGRGVHFIQRPPPGQLPPAPQPAMQNTVPPHVRQNFSRAQIGNQMGPNPGQFAQPGQNPQMGPRSLGLAPQMPNTAGPFPPRGGHSAQYQQSYPPPPLARPGGLFVGNQHSSPSGRPQVYDPFAPTAVAAQGSNAATFRKQESDPEYEDLMASVGVK